MTAASVLLALLCVGIAILFASTVTTWIQPAADVLADGIHAVAGSWGFKTMILQTGNDRW